MPPEHAQRPARLHALWTGAGPRVALVHGFTQTARSWRRVSRELEGDFEVVAPDLPGHGGSPVPNLGDGIAEAARDLGETCGKATYVGYSLGGRCCLHLALESPALVERLVIVGAHPGIGDEPSRRLRRQADEIRAAALDSGGDAGVPQFVEAWLAGPLFAHLTEEQADRASRLENSAAGLSASLRTVGTGTQEPLWDRLCELEMPVLAVAGSLDRKFGDLARRAVEAVGPNATLALVPGAGHAVAFERPDAFVALVRDFVAQSDPPPQPRAHSAIPSASKAPKAS